MKLRSLICSVTAALAVVLCLVAAPASAQQTAKSAVAAKPAMPSSAAAAPAAALSAEEVAKAALPSQPAPTPATPVATDGHPDLTGVWFTYRGVNLNVTQVGNTRVNLQRTSRAPESEDPDNNLSVNTRIYTAVAARREEEAKGAAPQYKPELQAKVTRFDRLEAKLDPGTHCKLPGIVRGGPPDEIVQSRGVVVFLYDSPDASYDYFRIIPIDKPHRTADQSNGLFPGTNGDSVGHWDGDTLVVDTTNYNDESWLGIDGWFHSDKMHSIERLRRDGETLHYQAVVEDPETLTRPYAPKAITLRLNTKDTRIDQEEPPCAELDTGDIVTPEHH